MDDLQKIRAFIDVVDNGSFSSAAREQGVSISSIARRVAALEDDLGVRLVNRNTRHLSVTEAGEIYYRRAQEGIRHIETARYEAIGYQEEVKGLLRVSLRTSFGAAVLPAMREFMEQYPDLQIELDLTDERADILKNNIDVAVWIGELKDSELIARLLNPGKRLLCASPGYLERNGVPKTPEDLESHRRLGFQAPDYDGEWHLRKGEQTWSIPSDGPFQSSSGLALMEAALCGLGVVVQQKYMVQRHLEDGTLCALLPDYEVAHTGANSGIYAIYPHSRHLAPKARAFIDFLIGHFKVIDQRPVPDFKDAKG